MKIQKREQKKNKKENKNIIIKIKKRGKKTNGFRKKPKIWRKASKKLRKNLSSIQFENDGRA